MRFRRTIDRRIRDYEKQIPVWILDRLLGRRFFFLSAGNLTDLFNHFFATENVKQIRNYFFRMSLHSFLTDPEFFSGQYRVQPGCRNREIVHDRKVQHCGLRSQNDGIFIHETVSIPMQVVFDFPPVFDRFH